MSGRVYSVCLLACVVVGLMLTAVIADRHVASNLVMVEQHAAQMVRRGIADTEHARRLALEAQQEIARLTKALTLARATCAPPRAMMQATPSYY